MVAWYQKQNKAAGPVRMDFLCPAGLRLSMLYTCELAGTFTQQTDPCEVAGLGVKGQR